jgi:hypothetical protein
MLLQVDMAPQPKKRTKVLASKQKNRVPIARVDSDDETQDSGETHNHTEDVIGTCNTPMPQVSQPSPNMGQHVPSSSSPRPAGGGDNRAPSTSASEPSHSTGTQNPTPLQVCGHGQVRIIGMKYVLLCNYLM